MLDDSELHRLRLLAAEYPAARLVVLFGSLARGAAAAWSDVDVAIAGLGYWEGLELGGRMGAATGREAHAVDLDRAPDLLRYRVAKDGVLLRESEPGAWPRFRAEAAVRYFDLAPIIELCREGARRRLLRDAGHA